MPEFIKKGTLAQVFSCEFCEISKNTILTEHVWTTASSNSSNGYSKYQMKGLEMELEMNPIANAKIRLKFSDFTFHQF